MKKAVHIVYPHFLKDDGAIQVGGIENYIMRLSQILSSRDYDVSIVQALRSNRTIKLPYATVHGVSCARKTPDYELVKYAEEQFDTDNDCIVFGSHKNARKTAFKRTIEIQRGIHWDGEEVPRIPRRLRCLYPVARFVEARQIVSQVNKADKVVCVDYNFVNWLRTQGSTRMPDLCVIPNFVDARGAWTKKSRDSRRIRLVYARRFVKRRGCELLASALPSLLMKHPEVDLTIAGEGPMEGYLREAFAGCERVTFTKYAPQDSISFHSQFDIALVPTIFSEGTSFSLLEAMCAGCCVLCTNVGGMTNIVIDGFNGRMVSPEGGQFASALEELVEDSALRERLAANAVASVSQGFSLESWGKRWLEVVNETFDDAR